MNPFLQKVIYQLISVERWPSQALVLPRIQSHRGYHLGGAQENSLQAMREARLKGALMFECDIRLSKDQIPVLAHDEDLMRLSSKKDLVSEMTAKELKTRGNISTLEEVLMDSQSPRLANIELKSKKVIDDPLERKASEVVRKCKAEKRVLFSSFNPMSIVRIGLHMPDVPRALLVSSSDDPENRYYLKHMLIAPALSFHMLNLESTMVTEESMNFWRKKRVPISAWTIREKSEIQKYLALGVVSVITDVL